MRDLRVGIKGIKENTVKESDLAVNISSGSMPVLATPVLICTAEQACKELVQPYLEHGTGTVGTLVNIRHLAPTPKGMKYRCECELTAVEGRRLTFSVKLTDEVETIGEGTHERFIIDEKRFEEKAERKTNAARV